MGLLRTTREASSLKRCDSVNEWLNDNIYWLAKSNFCAAETKFVQKKKELWREAVTKKGFLLSLQADCLLFVLPLQSWLAMNFIAIKSKLYNFFLLHRLTSNPRHDTYIWFIGRNLDSRTTMLEDHASQWIYNSRITTVFHEFSRFTLCLRSVHGSPLPDPVVMPCTLCSNGEI